MNKEIVLLEKEHEGFVKDLNQIKIDFSKQQGVKQSLLDRLEKDFNLKNQKEIEVQLKKMIKEQEELIGKLLTLKEEIKTKFSEILED
jgi:ribosomal protein S8